LGSEFLKVFVDDLNVHSKSWEDHLQHLEAVLAKLRKVNLKLNPRKCCFAARSIVFWDMWSVTKGPGQILAKLML